MKKVRFNKIDWTCAIIATLIALSIYVWTAAPNVTLQDSGEFTVAAKHFGNPHPTGYPLWTILSGLFLHIPLGNTGWQIGIFSGVCASLAVLLFTLIASHMLRWLLPTLKVFERSVIVLTFSLLLIFSESMWSQATIAEVYALHSLVIGLFILSLYRFIHDPQSDWHIIFSFFFFGLAFSNHHLTLALAPLLLFPTLLLRRDILWDLILFSLIAASLLFMAFASLSADLPLMKTALRFNWCCLAGLGVLLWYKRSRVEWKLLAFIPIALMLGLLPYAYMPFASSTNPPMNWGYDREMDGFYYTLNRSQYNGTLSSLLQSTIGRAMGTVDPQKVGARPSEPPAVPLRIRAEQWIGFFWLQLSHSFTPLCVLAFFAAFFSILRLDLYRRCWIYLLNIAFVLAAFFQPLMEDADITNDGWWLQMPYHTYTNWIFAMLCVCGFGFLWVKLTERYSKISPVIWVFLLLPLGTFNANYDSSSQRNRWFGWYFGHDMLKDLPRGSVVFGGTDPGRFVPTYMIFGESEQDASKKRDPYFDRRDLYIITQNALGDSFYEKYIRDHYTKYRPLPKNSFEKWLGRETQYPAQPLILPSPEDAESITRAFLEEEIHKNPDTPPDYGALAHSAIAKWIFEHNKKDHEFFVEESFPMEWSYPYAVPAGLVYRINPEPIALSKEVVEQDFAFWNNYIHMLTSDKEYYKDYDAERSFSKLRVTMGRIYSYRKMNKEAERAYRQALILWPESPETISLLSRLLWDRGEYDEPIDLFTKALAYDFNNFGILQMTASAIRRKKLYGEIEVSEAALKQNPKNKKAFTNLIDNYTELNDTKHLTALFQQGKSNFSGDNEILQRIAEYYFQETNYPSARQTVEQLTRLEPKNPRHWFQLACIAMQNGETNIAIPALQKAVAEGGLGYRELIQSQPIFNGLRTNPAYQKAFSLPVTPIQQPR
ncbi:MAG: DUF2723 domain-containing protein [Chthoniobacterales bacterium]